MTDGGRTHVIPNSINYSDVKPEQIENMVKLVRFTPTANVQQAQANDVMRFMLQGHGFLDPFSTYIDIEVDILPELSDIKSGRYTPAVALQRMSISSEEGTLAIGNWVDVVSHCQGPVFTYSSVDEQAHSSVVAYGKYLDRSAHSFIHRMVIRSQGEELERVEEYDVLAGMINDVLYSREQKKIHFNEGFPHSTMTGFNEVALLGGEGNTYQPLCGRGDQGVSVYLSDGMAAKFPVAYDYTGTAGFAASATNRQAIPHTSQGKFVVATSNKAAYLEFAQGQSEQNFVTIEEVITGLPLELRNGAGIPVDAGPQRSFMRTGSNIKKFTIPIYSGIIGVLIPEKKLIPLNLMPLELEFTLNPHALYCLNPNIEDPTFSRSYNITKFEIYGNVIMFEQQVHRALDQVVAQQGLYIPFNTFYLAPQSVNQGVAETDITAFSQINVYFKSINSIHSVFLYSGYRNKVYQRKLHFVSHNLTSLQLRNGTEFTPSERILGNMGEGQRSGGGNSFYIEMLKAYNKLHDPTTDAAFEGCNYFIDNLATATFIGPKTVSQLHTTQALLGRCQYGISLEGEEMGKDKTTLSGRRGQAPFDLMQVGRKTMAEQSNQLIFVRADMVVFIRQDLVVQLLGR